MREKKFRMEKVGKGGKNNILIGRHDGKIDEKSRLSFPKKFREILGDELIVTRGFESSLIVVSQEKWASLLEGTANAPLTMQSARETQRFLLGNVTAVALDEKGRFLLPEYLKKYAGLTNDVVFVGIVRYIEIWDMKKWEIYQEQLATRISSIANKLQEEKK